ncbi:hypothetical protein I6I20_10390 [Lactococcus garvieae]|nr:hypothetical protein I6I20_10390 [Lactococcus garvieae]
MKKIFIGGLLGVVLVSAALLTYLFLGPDTTDVRGKWVSFGENKLRVSAGSLRGDLVQASPFTKQEMVIRSDKNVKINPITHTITEKAGDFSVTRKFRMENNNEVLKSVPNLVRRKSGKRITGQEAKLTNKKKNLWLKKEQQTSKTVQKLTKHGRSG